MNVRHVRAEDVIAAQESEIELYAEARDPRGKDRRGLAEHRKAGVFLRTGIALNTLWISRFTFVPVRPNRQDVADSQIELIPAIPVHCALRDDVHRENCSTARERPSKRRQHDTLRSFRPRAAPASLHRAMH